MEPNVLLEVDDSLPLVDVIVGFRSGACHDPPEFRGLTNLALGALLTNAVESQGRGVECGPDDLGGRLACHVGTTATVLHLRSLTRHAEIAVARLADTFGNCMATPAFIAARDLAMDRLHATVENDYMLAVRTFREVFFHGHPFGQMAIPCTRWTPCPGTADARARLHDMLSSSNLVLGIAGDIDESVACRTAARLAASLSGTTELDNRLPHPRRRAIGRLVFLDRPETEQFQIIVGGLNLHPSDPDYVALALALAVLGGSPSSRLQHEVRAQRGLSYAVDLACPVDVCREAFTIWIQPAACAASECLDVVIDLIQEWWSVGINDAELQLARATLCHARELEAETPVRRLERRIRHSLFNVPASHDIRFPALVSDMEADEVNSVLTRWVDPSAITIAVVGPYDSLQRGHDGSSFGLDEMFIQPMTRA